MCSLFMCSLQEFEENIIARISVEKKGRERESNFKLGRAYHEYQDNGQMYQCKRS